MDKQGKVWGSTTTILARPHLSIHLLRIKEGGYSSQHRHQRKANRFHVVEGTLTVKTWPDRPNTRPDVTTLEAGEEMTIEPGRWHQFEAEEPTVAIEICEAAHLEEDIERRSKGGHG